MTLHEPSEQDLATLREAVQNSVLKNWAERCSAECVETWNNTIGKLTGLTASK
jgi:hypothetical protein